MFRCVRKNLINIFKAKLLSVFNTEGFDPVLPPEMKLTCKIVHKTSEIGQYGWVAIIETFQGNNSLEIITNSPFYTHKAQVS